MKHRFIIPVILSALCFANISDAQTVDSNFVDGRLYFKLLDSVNDTTLNLQSLVLAPLVALYQMDTVYRPFAGLGNDTLDRTYCLKFSSLAKTQQCMDTLRTLPIVDYVEQVPLFHTSFVPNDLNGNQYALLKIDAEQAWDLSKGSSSVVIAIVDNSVLSTHQDLAANIVAGYDVADNDNNTNPPAGFTSVFWNHGTHCAGIASAVTNNGIGIASIGFNCKIMPVKCTPDTSASGDEIDYADDGVTYAMRNGAKIISMSFGSYASSFTEQILMETAINDGIVLVSAAGNNDSSAVTYPAAYTGVICVGATDQNDVRANYSNYGSRVDVMAPGVSIYSTFATSDSAYNNFSGTSMACPMVAGLAGLVLSQNPSFTPAQVTTAITSGADNISAENPGFNGELGTGRINAFRSLGGTPQAINDVAQAGDINVYPNPFSNHIHLQLSNQQLPLTVNLLDMEGRNVINKTLTNGVAPEIETSPLPEGVYMLRLITADGVMSRMVVKM